MGQILRLHHSQPFPKGPLGGNPPLSTYYLCSLHLLRSALHFSSLIVDCRRSKQVMLWQRKPIACG